MQAMISQEQVTPSLSRGLDFHQIPTQGIYYRTLYFLLSTAHPKPLFITKTLTTLLTNY